MKLAIIVAAASNRVIGINNALPWYLPEDLKYFKRVTMGKPIIMGRKTYESIGKPLPGRTNIVITRSEDYQLEGCRVVSSLDEAMTLAENLEAIDGVDEAVIIGGAEIYKLALPQTSRLYLTQVHKEIEGDARFPEWNPQEWEEVGREDFAAEEGRPAYSFVVLDRKV